VSACVSPAGEYSDHQYGTAGDERYVCQRCWTFAEDAALARITDLETRLTQIADLTWQREQEAAPVPLSPLMQQIRRLAEGAPRDA